MSDRGDPQPMDADGPGSSQPDDSVPEPAVTYVACGASHSLALLSAPLRDLARLQVLDCMHFAPANILRSLVREGSGAALLVKKPLA